MNCPNSSLCYNTEEKPYFKSKSYSKEANKIMQDKNFIIESIKSENCNDVNIWFYKDKTIEIQDFKGKNNIKYIDMQILKQMYETSKKLGWIEE